MWTKETLLFSDTKTVKVCGNDITIRALSSGEVMKKGDDNELVFERIAASLVDPKITIEEAKKMPLDRFNALLAEITAFNSMNKEANQGN